MDARNPLSNSDRDMLLRLRGSLPDGDLRTAVIQAIDRDSMKREQSKITLNGTVPTCCPENKWNAVETRPKCPGVYTTLDPGGGDARIMIWNGDEWRVVIGKGSYPAEVQDLLWRKCFQQA